MPCLLVFHSGDHQAGCLALDGVLCILELILLQQCMQPGKIWHILLPVFNTVETKLSAILDSLILIIKN